MIPICHDEKMNHQFPETSNIKLFLLVDEELLLPMYLTGSGVLEPTYDSSSNVISGDVSNN